VEVPIVTRDKTVSGRNGFSGLGIEYLEYLQRILGFTCSSLEEYDPKEDIYSGFNGFTHYLANCSKNGDSAACLCDIGIAAFSKTSERLSNVDFVAPLAYDSISAVQKTSTIKNHQGRTPFFLTPYTPLYVLPLPRFQCMHQNRGAEKALMNPSCGMSVPMWFTTFLWFLSGCGLLWPD
jgi:hypothetical protein